MPLAGKGMLLTSMDIDPSDEAEFNRWYDREHLLERVAIDGFLEARRYIAHQGSPKYLCLYSTASFEVLDSPTYRTVLMNPTDWSKTNLARFKNMIRAIARITVSRGQGRGAALAPRSGPRRGARHRPPPSPCRRQGQSAHRTAESARPRKSGRHHLHASDRERSGTFQADHRRSPGFRSGFRRLVRADRCDGYPCGLGGHHRPPRGCAGADSSRNDLDRRLQTDVGPGEERHSVVLDQGTNLRS